MQKLIFDFQVCSSSCNFNAMLKEKKQAKKCYCIIMYEFLWNVTIWHLLQSFFFVGAGASQLCVVCTSYGGRGQSTVVCFHENLCTPLLDILHRSLDIFHSYIRVVAVRVPRVPGHPQIFDNGCQSPVLREALLPINPIQLKISMSTNYSSFLFWKIGLNPRFFLGGHPSSESPGVAPVP